MDDELRAVGLDVEVRTLTVADYAIGAVLVERKRVRDLHLSIIERRLWRQVARLRDESSFPYLLVEGEDIDAGPLSERSVRGALIAVEELGVGVIRSAGASLWLAVVASRSNRLDGAPAGRYHRRARPRTSSQEAMLAAVPGISTGCARSLIAAFETVAAVVEAGPENWLSVPGIGPVRAAALARTLYHS
jgi:ERCC4-type nuclease